MLCNLKDRQEVTLDHDEYITEVITKSGAHLDSIKFITNKRDIGGTGVCGISETPQKELPEVSHKPPPGYVLGWISGRSGEHIDADIHY